jgi:preprotein translocase SecF subunit
MPWPLVKLVPRKTNFKFVRFATYAATFSIVCIVATFVSIFTGGFRENPIAIYETQPGGVGEKIGAVLAEGFSLGIDFKGGVSMEVVAAAPIDIGKIRDDLSGRGLGEIQLQSFGDTRHALVRFQPDPGKTEAQAARNAQAATAQVKAEIAKLIPGATFSPPDIVGPKVSGELFSSGLIALGLAILLMLVYIWFRFEWQFGVGAVFALFHDTILTLGLFSLFRIEFTLTIIAALLTIIGYSMNDTVVVFDRLRENMRKYKRTSLKDLIDLSTNETLSRTMITSLTALIAAIALLYFGGPTLEGFAIAMIFGIVIGTYSSIYVAAPAILLWGVKRGEGEQGRESAPTPATG